MASSQDHSIKTPQITTSYDEALKKRKRAVKVTQGTTAHLQFTFRDDCGEPVDLTTFGFSTDSSSSSSTPTTSKIEARFREASLHDNSVFSVAGTVVDAEKGTVKCTIPKTQVMDVTGVWLASVGVFNTSAELVLANEMFIYNEKSPWITSGTKGPPTIDDVRLSIRDSDPLVNELIDNHDYDVAEIAHAATRCVQYWNEQPPPVPNAIFTALNFPFREIWLKGIQLFLFQIIEEHYRRNRLPYNAGGTQIDDKNKQADYNRAWSERLQEFRQLVMHRKAQLNANNAFGSVMSRYS